MKSVSQQALRSGSFVSFRLADAVCPGFGQIAGQIGPDVRVCGEVAFFSDRGRQRGHFAIITVEGVATPVIVPVAKLEPYAPQAGTTQPTPETASDVASSAADPVPELLDTPATRREAG